MLNSLLRFFWAFTGFLRPVDFVVLVVGGRSSRFFPFGSKLFEQFRRDCELPILGKRSLFQTRLLLFRNVSKRIVVVGGEEFRAIAEQQSREVGVSIYYVEETERKDTAPAFLLALATIRSKLGGKEDSVVVLAPSDHYHGDTEQMKQSLIQGVRLVRRTGKIGTFVVKPRFASESFSYLVPGEDQITVQCFVQKPNREKAKALIKKGAGWGLGMHIGPLSSLVSAINEHDAFQLINIDEEVDWITMVPSINLEGDILCRTEKDLIMIDCSASKWSDLGSAEELAKLLDDSYGHRLFGEFVAEQCANILGINLSPYSLYLRGIRDMVIALSSDGQLLVAPQGQAERLKALLGRMSDSPYVIDGSHRLRGQSDRLKRLLVFGDHPVSILVSIDKGMIVIDAM